MFQQQYGNMQGGMGQQYSNYPNNANAIMQGNMQGNQQMIPNTPTGMFAGQQQGFGQPRPPQPDYRGMGQNQRPQYMQQAPNVTMNANLGGMGGPAPPYSRPATQGMQQTQFQQQQRMRQQMLAMQQQQQQQQQGGPQGAPALVAHLQRHINPNPYPHQPPPYNM